MYDIWQLHSSFWISNVHVKKRDFMEKETVVKCKQENSVIKWNMATEIIVYLFVFQIF